MYKKVSESVVICLVLYVDDISIIGSDVHEYLKYSFYPYVLLRFLVFLC